MNNWIVALEDCIEPVYDVKNIIKNNKVKLAEYYSCKYLAPVDQYILAVFLKHG